MLKFKRLTATAKLPIYATPGAAGMDLYADEAMFMPSGARSLVRTSLAVEIPEGYELQCRPRSGLAARHGITVLNSPGTIDSDYRGEIKVILYNSSRDEHQIFRGDRIAQLVLAKVEKLPIIEVEELSDTQRGGEGGFGSTG